MPELPEVETVRAGLADHVLGRTIAGVQVYRERAVRGQAGGPGAFADLLLGARIRAAVRRGKFCWLILEGSDGEPLDHALLAHLGMSGQLLVRSNPGGEHKHLRVRITMTDGSQVWFVDQRTFGYLQVAELVPTLDGLPGGYWGASRSTGLNEGELPDQLVPLSSVPFPVAHIARDLLDPVYAAGTPGRAALRRRMRASHREIKRVLLDQTVISGIGNIYADEALWRARVHYRRDTHKMRGAQLDAVLDAATAVMSQALEQGGTSFDALYVNVNGASGYFDRSLAVYGQRDRHCPRCGAMIVREAFMNRSSFLCRRCQRRPRG